MDRLNVTPIVKTSSHLFTNEPTLFYWLVINPNTIGTQATLKIYDGWNTGGVERLRITTGYDRPFVAIPPLRCQDALYVDIDGEVASYTVAYRTEASLKPAEE